MPLRYAKTHQTIPGLVVGTIVLLVAMGCNDGLPKRVPVSGQVMIDGKPVTAGSIRFVPEGARPSSGDLDPDGRFVLSCFADGDGAVVGTHRIQIAAREITSENSVRWLAPQRYSDLRNSGIVVEITGPVDDLVIELTWDKKKQRGG